MRSPSLLQAPRVAWPTLLVFAGAIAASALSVVLGAAHALPAPLAFAVATLAAYAAFTPLHEAAHRSLSRARWMNEVVGRVAGLVLLGPFPAVRHLHLEHHKHTNDPAADPDFWSGRGPRWALPLRWLTQDLHYYALYARRLRARPPRESIEVVASLALLVAAVGAACACGHAREALLFWVLPARVAVGVLAFAFDFLPHRPHHVTAREDRMRATSAFEGRALFAATFGQSLHLVHHVYPGVPFYRYARVWRDIMKPCRVEREA